MFCLLIYLRVLIPVSCFVVLVFCSVSSSTEYGDRPNRSQVVRIELPCVSVS